MSRLEFPNEPIREPADRHLDGSMAFDDLDLYDTERCNRCEGDGVIVCDGGVECPEADDCGCPFVDFHTYRCDECGGKGFFKTGLLT